MTDSKESEHFIAYFDLLEVTSASKGSSRNTYVRVLEKFRTAITEIALEALKPGDLLHAFSDCAFVESSDLDRLCTFISDVRNMLMNDHIFFRGAIAVGKLDPKPYFSPGGKGMKSKELLRDVIHGHWFSNDCVRLAEAEKNLKGIGVEMLLTDAPLAIVKKASQWLRYTCYVDPEPKKPPKVFADLVLPKEDLAATNSLLETFLIKSHSSRRIGRYYIPLILNWIQAYDYAKLPEAAERNSASIDALPLPFVQLVMNERLRRELLGLPGCELFYYSLLSKITRESTHQIREGMVAFMGNQKKLRDAAMTIPELICPLEIQERVVDRRVKSMVEMSQARDK